MITKTQTQIFNGCRGFIDSTDWDAMSSEEQQRTTDELASNGQALVRVWNPLRHRDILTVEDLEHIHLPTFLQNITSSFEFGIDCEDHRIPGAEDIKFVIDNHDTREEARQTLLKFLESLKRYGVED